MSTRNFAGKFLHACIAAIFWHRSSTVLLPKCTDLSSWFHIPPKPVGCPLDSELTNFITWSQDIVKCHVWTVFPKDASQVADLANWAMVNGYSVRPSGQMHSWSDLTLPLDVDNQGPLSYTGNYDNESIAFQSTTYAENEKIVLMKTSNLKKIRVYKDTPTSHCVEADVGVLVEDLLQELENQNLAIAACPAPGDITVGGVFAVGGHGTGVPLENESEIPPSGFTYGSLSNLVIAFQAAVFDQVSGKYVLRNFTRSESDTNAFLVSLGRACLTKVTFRVGPSYNLRCVSYTDILADEFYAESAGPNSLSSIAGKTGRFEAIQFAYTQLIWLKVWIEEQEKPLFSKEVHEPYNYVFSDNLPVGVTNLQRAIVENNEFGLAPALGKAMHAATVAGLAATGTADIWGPSKNSLLYIKKDTFRLLAIGYVIVTKKDLVQKAVHESYKCYNTLLNEFRSRGQFPINGALECRVTGMDRKEDSLYAGAESPGISAACPVEGRPDLNRFIWFDFLTYGSTPFLNDFMVAFEDCLIQKFNSSSYVLRIEWSKAWGFTNTSSTNTASPWSNANFIKHCVGSLPYWKNYTNIMKKYDPFSVFHSSFVERIDTFVSQ